MYFAANPFMEHTQYTGGKIDEEMLHIITILESLFQT